MNLRGRLRTADVRCNESIYRIMALERHIYVRRLPHEAFHLLSTEESALQSALARAVFNGFRWDDAAVQSLIAVYEGMEPGEG
jgi:hypothetical protein